MRLTFPPRSLFVVVGGGERRRGTTHQPTTMNDTEKAKLEQLLRDILNLAAEIKGRHAASVIGCKAQDALAIVAR